jgi:predicted ATPase
MGVHTGTGVLDRDGSYVGSDVHRAARIGATGAGAQIVLSSVTRALVGGSPLPGVTVRDLGEHKLKDLRPERLGDLVIDGLVTEFAPLRTVDRRTDNLPPQLTSLVGREAELAKLTSLIDGTRLLTLTGPGGVGKTRLSVALASAVADRFPDGVFFVPLEPIADPALVPATIARTLGIMESGSRTAMEMLLEHVAERRLLLVLDNFEQVVAAAPTIAELLRAGSGLKVVASSRAVLRISGETEFAVPGLPVPPDPTRLSETDRARLSADARRLDRAAVEGFEAVRLFVARGAAARPGFELTDANAATIARICARLDGLPLAIELAAARLKILAPEAILERLERQFEVLASVSRDVPERQRTLRGAIAWSYDLLDPPAGRLLDRLAVFMGGFELEMAERVAGSGDLGIDVLDGIGLLVDQSLVGRSDEGGEPRFRLLEAIRLYALERLTASGEAEAILDGHARAYLDLAEVAEPNLAGDEQRDWLERLERENENLRAALIYATERPETEVALRLVSALWRFWQKRGYLTEARRRADAALALPGALDDPRLAARALEAAGGIAWWQGQLSDVLGYYTDSLAYWRIVGDDSATANALYNLGLCGFQTEEWDTATAMLDEALGLFTRLGDDRGIGNVEWAYGQAEFYKRGDSEVSLDERARRAIAFFHSAREHFRKGGERTMEAWSLHMSGLGKLRVAETDDAIVDLQHALDHFLGSGDIVGTAMTLDDLAIAAGAIHRFEDAVVLKAATRELQRSAGADLFAASQALFPDVWPTPETGGLAPEVEAELTTRGQAMSLDEAVALGRSIVPAEGDLRSGTDE